MEPGTTLPKWPAEFPSGFPEGPAPIFRLADLTLCIGEPEFYERLATLIASVLTADGVALYLSESADRIRGELVFQAGSVPALPASIGFGSLDGLPTVVHLPAMVGANLSSTVRWMYDDQVLVCMALERQTRILITACNSRGSGTFGDDTLAQCRFLLPLLSAAVSRHARTAGVPVRQLDELTSRENEIVLMILEGHCSESIARSLNISYGTVKIHKKNIYRKLRVSSEPELLRLHMHPRGDMRG